MENTNDKTAVQRYSLTMWCQLPAAVQDENGPLMAYKDHVAALSARAEEARREAEQSANRAIANYVAYIAELEAKITQRTAGGDAVSAALQGIQGYDSNGNPTDSRTPWFYDATDVERRLTKAALAHPPVAAAAAQADGWIHEDMADDETAAVASLPRKELVAYYKQPRADLAYYPAAPTAQPTTETWPTTEQLKAAGERAKETK